MNYLPNISISTIKSQGMRAAAICYDRCMKQLMRGLLLAVLIVTSVATGAHASTNDFTFKSLHADYYLGADSEGRSTLKTTETLVAVFPDYDQNHGIERAIPKKYDGHPTSLKILAVTDKAGTSLPYSTYDSNGHEVLRIGDADRYVHGEQTYVITYVQRDVTKYFADVPDHEFYWDVNGTQWQQPFDEVSATVHTDKNITPTLNKNVACYQGVEGSTERCEISEDGNVITAKATNLWAGENMTIAVGFTSGTFRGYQPSLWDRIVSIWIILTIITSVVGFVAIFWLAYRYSKLSNRSSELQPVAAEYIPPKDTSVLVSAQIADGARADATAQLIDLAVRHYITITQTAEKSLFKQAEYDLEIVKSVSSLREEEQDFVRTMFGDTAVGTVLPTKTLKQNYGLYSKLQSNTTALAKRIKESLGLRAKNQDVSKSFKRIGLVFIFVGVLTISPLLFIAGIVAYGCGWGITPLTDEGLALRRYLAGLKMYIEYAENDRIKALQSPEGAEKTGVKIKDGNDKKLVRLYERTLPYAVLFGQEKEWNKQLAVHYEESGTTPSWYVGHGAFSAAVFSSAMSDFTGSMNSYGASTSSSTGGSSGGGSSGGGGGGGGGGGW